MHSASGEGQLPFLQAACDQMVDAMLIVDDQGRILYRNQAARRLLGAGEEHPDGHHCRNLLRCGTFGEPNRLCGSCALQEALERQISTTRFLTAVGHPEDRRVVEASIAPLPGGGPAAAVLVLRHREGADKTKEPQSQSPLSPNSTAVLKGLVRSARELLVADYAALGRLDVQRLEVEWLVQEGSLSATPPVTRVPLGRGIRGRVISTGQPICIPNFPETTLDPPEQHLTMLAEKLRAALAVPIMINDEPAGVLMVACRRPAEYGPDQTQVLRNLAGLAGEVLSHSDWIIGAQAESIRAEREWLAAELHDGLAQLLGALTQRLKLARWVLGRSTDPASVAADIQEVVELSEQAHQELRLALGELRSTAADGDFREALDAALHMMSDRTGLKAELVSSPDVRPQFSPIISLQILRIVQEALNNARKHSGGTRVWVRWTHAPGLHTFSIQDDGKGFISREVGRGFGLTIMADRARRIGGALHVYGAPDCGCTVVLTVPDHEDGGGTAGDTHSRTAR